ncbi:MAG: RHS repeat-associated core domain-containing protein [Opitutales bacterium]|nr:RHS repeat-associated core domain-containing protein [Opitutales bacterium]
MKTVNIPLLLFVASVFCVLPAVGQQVDQPVTVQVKFEFAAQGDAHPGGGEPSESTTFRLYLNSAFGSYSQSDNLLHLNTQEPGSHSLYGLHWIDLPVGDLVELATTSVSLSDWEMFVTAPPGYSVVINGRLDSYLQETVTASGGAYMDVSSQTNSIAVVPDSFEGRAAGEVSTPQIGRFLWDIGLGYGVNGSPSGLLTVREPMLGNITKREKLRLMPAPNAELEIYRDATGLRRLRTDILVDITDLADGYQIEFYPHTGFDAGADLDAPAGTLITGLPWRRITLRDVDGSVELRVYRVVTAGFSALLEKHTLSYDAANKKWTMDSGTGSTAKRTITHDFDANETEAVIEVREGSEIARRTKKTYQTVAGQPDVQTVVEDYGGGDYTTVYVFDPAKDWLQSVRRADGGWEYHTHDYFGRMTHAYRPFKDTPSSPSASFSGEVTRFEYGQFPVPDFSGGFSFQALQSGEDYEFRNLPTLVETTVGSSSAVVSRAEYAYDKSASLNGIVLLAATRKDYASAPTYYTSVSRRYTAFAEAGDELWAGLPVSEENPDGTKSVWLHQPGAYTEGQSTLTGFTPASTYAPGGNNRYWRTITFHGRASGSGTISSFASGPRNAIDPIRMEQNMSTIEVTVRGNQGRVVRRELYVFSGSNAAEVSSYELVDWEQMNYRPEWGYRMQWSRSIRTPPGGYDAQYNHHSGRLYWMKNAVGQEFEYLYDTLGRRVIETLINDWENPERSVFFWHNAAGDVTAEALVPGLPAYPADPDQLTASPRLVSKTEYDNAGRVTRRIAADGVETRWAYEMTGGFHRRVRRTKDVPSPTNPNATTTAHSLEQYHLDGRPQWVIGNAIVPRYFSYSVLSGGNLRSTESVASSSSPRWSAVTSDWLGRETERRAPNINGGDLVATFDYYGPGEGGDTAKLRKVTAPGRNPVLFQYDNLGRLWRQGLDVHNNGSLDPASLDRVTDFETKFVKVDSDWFLEESAYTYPDDNASGKILLSRTRERLTGFANEAVPQYGVNRWKRGETYIYDTDSTTSTTAWAAIERDYLDPGTRRQWAAVQSRGETNHAVALREDGLLRETLSEAGVKTRYTYDSLGRAFETITRESGSAKVVERTEYFDNSPRVHRLRRSRGNGTANQLVTEYAYFINGAVRSEKNADNQFTYYLYNRRGQLTHRWGTATTPVRFDYNTYGERHEMRTYQTGGWSSSSLPADFTSGTASLTKWSFDEATGLLKQKTDPSNEAETYTYDNAHRLHVRTRARGVYSTRGYSPQTGELTSVTYSDSTPDLAFTYNRLGAKRNVTDATGTRTYHYRSLDQRLNYVALPGAFYGSGRRLTVDYEDDRRLRNGLRIGYAADTSFYYRSDWEWEDARVSKVFAYERGSSVDKMSFDYNFVGESNIVRGYHTTGVNGQTFAVDRTYRDHENRVSRAETTLGSTVHAAFDYKFDEMGRIESVEATGKLYDGFGSMDELRTQYTYSNSGRLVSASGAACRGTGDYVTMDSRFFHYAYDSAGNRNFAGITTGSTNWYVHDDFRTQYKTNAANAYTEYDNPVYDTFSGSVDSGSPAVYDFNRGLWIDSEITQPGLGGVFEHIFDTTVGQNTSEPHSRGFWFLNPGVGSVGFYYPPTVQEPVYDEDGNLTFDGYLHYEYDAENRLTNVTSVSINGWVFELDLVYDYRGRRVQAEFKRTLMGNTHQIYKTRYLYDGFQLIAEIDASDGVSGLPVTSTYFWGYDISHTLGGAGGIGGLLLIDHGKDASNNPRRYLPGYDSRGNVVLLIRESDGEQVAGFEYDPYGNILRAEGEAHLTPFRYQTKWDMDYGMEADTSWFTFGLVDYGLRYYNPKHGRFINRDPIGEAGGLNLYEAFGGDPVNRWDFLGLRSQGPLGRARGGSARFGLLEMMVRQAEAFGGPSNSHGTGSGDDSGMMPSSGFPFRSAKPSWMLDTGNAQPTGASGDDSNVHQLPDFYVHARDESVSFTRSAFYGFQVMNRDAFVGFTGIDLSLMPGVASLSFADGWGIRASEGGGAILLELVPPRSASATVAPAVARTVPRSRNRVTLAQMERYSDSVSRTLPANFAYGWRTYRDSVRDEFANPPTEVMVAMYAPFWVPAAVYAPVAAQVTWRALPAAPVGAPSTQTFLNTTGLRQLNTVDGAAFATGRVFTATGALGSNAMMRAGLITTAGGYGTATGIGGFALGYNTPMDQPDPVLFFNPATSSFVTWSFVGGAMKEFHDRLGNDNP